MKKVLLFNTYYFPNGSGGAERSTQLLAEGLLEKSFLPVVVSTSDTEKTEIVNGVKVYYMKPANIYWQKNSADYPFFLKPIWHLVNAYNFLARTRLQRIIESEKPDLIHTNNLLGITDQVWSVASEKNIPIVHTIRDHHQLCFNSVMFKNGKNCVNRCVFCKVVTYPNKALSQKVNAVVGISEYILNKHLDFGYFKLAEIKEVIGNSSPQASLNISDIPTKDLRFAYVGDISEGKGVGKMISEFIESKITATLFIYGSASNHDYESQLKARYEFVKNVRFMGYKNTDQIFPSIDCLIVPSIFNEAFGRVIVEAYSYGVPVIGSKGGGIPELIDQNKTGFLFDISPKGELSDLLKKIDRDVLGSMRTNCLEKARSFTNEFITEKYISIYNRLLKV